LLVLKPDFGVFLTNNSSVTHILWYSCDWNGAISIQVSLFPIYV